MPILWHVEDPEAGEGTGVEPPPPADPPAGDPPPPAPEGDESTAGLIDKYNQGIEEGSDEDSGDESDGEGEGDESDGAGEGEAQGKPDTDEAAPVVTFEDTDDLTAVLEKGTKLKEAYEFSPEVQTYIEKLEAQAQGTTQALADIPASVETVKKVVGAFDAMFDPANMVDDGQGGLMVSGAPVAKMLRDNYGNEFRPIAEAVLAADSTKYQGASVLQELLTDNFGADKASNALSYLQANIPLPVLPAGIKLPTGITDDYKEAYLALPEVKRFEMEGLIDEVTNLRERLADAPEYSKPDIQTDLAGKEAKLNAELKLIEDAQFRINRDRTEAETRERQKTESVRNFINEVNAAYTGEIYGMADDFAKDLATKLADVVGDASLPLARDAQTRVLNAMAFTINADGTYSKDPMADYYAKQLNEEGIKIKFDEARELLQRHHHATAYLTRLQKTPNVSRQAIEKAEAAKKSVLVEIKAQQKELLGQISTKYVRGNAANLKGKVAEQNAKRQGTRPRIQGSGGGGNAAPAKPVGKAIGDYNRQHAQRIANGDELFNAHAG